MLAVWKKRMTQFAISLLAIVLLVSLMPISALATQEIVEDTTSMTLPDSSISIEEAPPETPKEGGDATLQAAGTITVGMGTPSATHANTLEDALQKVDSGGTIQVTDDSIILSDTIIIDKHVTLCSSPGARRIISQSAWGESKSMFDLGIGGQLILKDIIIDGSGSDKGRIIYVHGGFLMLESGATLRNKINTESGIGGYNAYGAGIFVYNAGGVTMNAGSSIENCKAPEYGGGIATAGYATSTSTAIITMNGGEIRNCTAAYGGGIYIGASDSNPVKLMGGVIADCTATTSGGGILVSTKAELSGVTITGCKAGYSGDGVFSNAIHGLLVSGDTMIGIDDNDNSLYLGEWVYGRTIMLPAPLGPNARINYQGISGQRGQMIAQPDLNADPVYAITESDMQAFHFKNGDWGVLENGKLVFYDTAGLTVELSETRKHVQLGEQVKLTATLSYGNVPNGNITWSSSNPQVATVTADGTVTTLANGTTMIVATSQQNQAFATCTIYSGPRVTGITLSESARTVMVTEPFDLYATVSPDDALDKHFIWSSSDPTIAYTYDKGDGLTEVTGAAVGTAVITATTADGAKTAQCVVTVVPVVPCVKLDVSEATIQRTESIAVKAIDFPKSSGTRVRWASSNPEIVAVPTELVSSWCAWNITGIAPGTATIPSQQKMVPVVPVASLQ